MRANKWLFHSLEVFEVFVFEDYKNERKISLKVSHWLPFTLDIIIFGAFF